MAMNKHFGRGLLAAALLGGGLTVSVAGPSADAAADMTCSTPTLYSINTSGMVISANTTTGATTNVFDINGSQSGTTNGLGISVDGSTVWALVSSSGTPRKVFKHLRSTETTTTLNMTETPTNDLGGGVIAGAVDPVSGSFFYGGYNGGTTMRLYRVAASATTNQTLTRYLTVSLPGGLGGSGDIAFDSTGNLYMIQSNGTSVRLFRISEAQVAAGGAQTATSLFQSSTADNYNGVAIDGNGTIWAQYTTSGNSGLRPIDPNSGALGAVTVLGAINGTDIGVCSLPSSLTLGTDVVGRGLPSDQFTVEMTVQGIDLNGASATTSGNSNGTQTSVAGPIVAVTGRTYTLTLVPTGSATLADYAVTYECLDQNNAVVLSGNGSQFSFTIPSTGGMTYSCSFSAVGPNAGNGDPVFQVGDSGLGGGATCSATSAVDRLPRMWVGGLEVSENTVVYDNTYDQPSGDYMVLSGSWQVADGALKQLNSCGYDYTALLMTEPLAHYEMEATFAAIGESNQGGIVLHQSSDQTRSGAMLIDLANNGTTLRWGSYDNAGYYVNVGSTTVSTSGDVTLKAVVRGTNVVIYLNGTQVATATATNGSGHVGLTTSVTSVAFKSVLVTAIPAI
jgi:hypothetical protein